MSTLDYYQNLRSLVSTSVMDNLPQIEDNLKNLFEDISTYFYFHGDEETSFKRNEMVVKAKLSIKHPIVIRLNEEGKLIASCQPVLLSILSIKEIRMLFKMDSEIYNPQNLSNRVRHGTNPVNGLGKGTYRQTVLNGPMKKSLRKRFGKYPKQDYKELSERPGDFFQQATAFQKRETVPQGKDTLSLFDSFFIAEAGGDIDKDAIYKFASYRQEQLSSFSYATSAGRGIDPWGALCTLTRPKLVVPKWIKILTRFSSGRTREVRKTKTRLNRLQPQRFDLSGEIKERRPEVVCAIDTSGSRYADRIKKALGQVLALKVKFNYSITLIECDAKIQKITEIKKKSDIPDEYHGRGGTSYLPVIDYINSHPRYRNALLIYFTDGYGDGEIPKPKVRQTVWVLTGGDYLSLKKPYGDVVLIDGEKTIKRSR